MVDLLKTDLRRILVDKLFIVCCVLGVVFALFTPFLYALIVLILGEGLDVLALFTTSKSLFFTAFNPSGNFGLVVPILIAVVLCKDFSHGTVRNKIICGKKRRDIFLSMFLSATIVMCALMLLHALMTLTVSLFFFPYGVEFDAGELGYFLLSLLFSLLLYVLIAAVVSLLCVLMKNTGLTVVLYIALNFLFSIIGTVVSVAAMLVDAENKFAVRVLEILQKSNLFITTHIGTGTTYTATDVLCVLIPALGGTALFLFLGDRFFAKKDLK